MREIVFRALKVVLLVSVAAGLAAMLTDGLGTVLLDSYLLAIGAVLLLALVRTLRVRIPADVPSPFDAALAEMRRRSPNSAETPLVNEVRLSRLSAFHVHVRLRPLLSEIAAHRLWSHYGVELKTEPARASELIGPGAWELVRPDRPPPVDRLARGLPLPELRKIVAELEQL